MTLLQNKPPQMAIILAQYVMSSAGEAGYGCTNVIGGVITAGSLAAAAGSALLTWSPAFVSAPVIIAALQNRCSTVTSPSVRFTGIGVSTAYVMMATGNNANSCATISLMLVGEAKL